jgi:hypothetical protein
MKVKILLMHGEIIHINGVPARIASTEAPLIEVDAENVSRMFPDVKTGGFFGLGEIQRVQEEGGGGPVTPEALLRHGWPTRKDE